MNSSRPSAIRCILKEKCPFCGEGDVFEKKSFFEVPEVNPHCSSCGHDLQGEPGFYFGAMYVSYGLSVGLGILLFLVLHFVAGVRSVYWQIGIIFIGILLFAKKNYRWSRIIWLMLFPPKKKKKARN